MDLFKLCKIDKNLLEKELKDIIVTDNELNEKYQNLLLDLILANGKRIRPIFTIVGSKLGSEQVMDIYKFAAVFELVHTATLIHDDVIDNASTRRNIPTLHTITDELTAIMLGNYLMARCAEYVSINKLEKFYFENLHFTDLCHSEVMQQKLLFNFNITLDEYIEKTKNKTALLIAASFIAGAELSQTKKQTIKYLYKYSINLGISFQIIDDILDFTEKSNHLGKPVGQDLMNGNITLPVILALKNKKIKEKVKNLNTSSTREEFNDCINDIINSGIIEKSKKYSQNYLNKARKAMDKINSTEKAIFYDILDELEQRTF